ncbi:Stp1/IreP family PP2C-type Ser/Thr phosphatase [Candidatus Symbiobacter mobilis]|uniref:Protein phosphatase n=1 Tax=Candidatus Symbiobacter mobilis CR TaxID=946483 RepID=U5NCU7_9BURK|nr:Stp1/IreP family PP2C-type Ser/Thr phosphatase [Candidatus Symbiobacter mobilis]AGX88063.1 protein phosphatase [Candidatus Symbiobacter mobilis CR]
MMYSHYALTDPGLVRTNNEDAFLLDETTGVVVLADGMGGYNAGEIASGMATTFIQSEVARWMTQTGSSATPEKIAQAIEISVFKTNLSIFQSASSNPQYAGMGTTLVVGVFHGPVLVLGHVGDSRCYRLRDHKLLRITKDHSMLQEQVDAGLLTAQEASKAPGKNLLTRALGVEENVQIELHTHSVCPNDLYLMCSDGLTDMVDDDRIAELLDAGTPLEDTAQALIRQATQGGGRDNITVVLTRAHPVPERPGLLSRLLGRAANHS